jgi:hypothetical protein
MDDPQLSISKNTTTVAVPFARPSGMGDGINSHHPRKPLCDGLGKGAYEGFNLII